MLYDWQKDLIDKIKHYHAYGLFLDMGLGKTPISLALAEVNQCNKILVVTVNAKATETIDTPGSWHQWCVKAGPKGYTPYTKKFPDTVRRDTCDALIINYEALYKRGTESVELTRDVLRFIDACAGQRVCLIIDESHKIKDSSSTQAKALALIKAKLKVYGDTFYTYLCTGTPFTTGFIDLYNQLKFLGCPMTKTEFKNRFCVMGEIRGLLGWQQPIVGYKNIDELYQLIHKYAVTIKSSEVLTLPPQIFVTQLCPKTHAFTLLTKKLLTEAEIIAHTKIRIENGIPILPKNYKFTYKGKKIISPWYRDMGYPNEAYMCDTPASLWLRARQLSIGFQGNEEESYWFDKSRFDELKKLLTEAPDNYVLFYNYTPEFYELYSLCTELGYKVDVYNGPLKYLTYYDIYANQSPEARLVNKKNIILSNYASGATGKNWQLYSKCILFSVPLYKDWEQGLKRVHRTGSTEPVTYYVFIGDNWLDKDMKKALDEGVQYSQDMFDKKLNKELYENGNEEN